MTDTQLLALAEKIRLRLGGGDMSLHRAIDSTSKSGRITVAEARQLRFVATMSPKAAKGEASPKALADAVYAAEAWLAFDIERVASHKAAAPVSDELVLPQVIPSSESSGVALSGKSRFAAAVAGACLVAAAVGLLTVGALK